VTQGIINWSPTDRSIRKVHSTQYFDNSHVASQRTDINKINDDGQTEIRQISAELYSPRGRQSLTPPPVTEQNRSSLTKPIKVSKGERVNSSPSIAPYFLQSLWISIDYPTVIVLHAYLMTMVMIIAADGQLIDRPIHKQCRECGGYRETRVDPFPSTCLRGKKSDFCEPSTNTALQAFAVCSVCPRSVVQQFHEIWLGHKY